MTTTFFGLNNYGATCWLNATYQALLSCPRLIAHISKSYGKQDLSFARILSYTTANYLFSTQYPISSSTSDVIGNLNSDFRQLDASTFMSPSNKTPQTELEKRAKIIAKIRAIPNFPPIVSCAILDSHTQNSQLGAQFFASLALHCAHRSDSPFPVYHANGDVDAATFGMIIRAISAECPFMHLFDIDTTEINLCTHHLRDIITANPSVPSTQQPIIPQSSRDSEIVSTIQATPIMLTANTVKFAPPSFETMVRATISSSTKKCDSVDHANHLRSRDNGFASVTIRTKFSDIVAIFVEDIEARQSIISSSNSSVYRRAPIGVLQVPRYLNLPYIDGGNYVYRIVAQIIEEGGHFTALASRSEDKFAYISDTRVIPQTNMCIAPGACLVIYERTETSVAPPAITTLQAIHQAVRAYYAQNSRDFFATPIERAPTNTDGSQYTSSVICANPNFIHKETPYNVDMREFYALMIGISIRRAKHKLTDAEIRAFFENNVGMNYISACASNSSASADHILDVWNALPDSRDLDDKNARIEQIQRYQNLLKIAGSSVIQGAHDDPTVPSAPPLPPGMQIVRRPMISPTYSPTISPTYSPMISPTYSPTSVSPSYIPTFCRAPGPTSSPACIPTAIFPRRHQHP